MAVTTDMSGFAVRVGVPDQSKKPGGLEQFHREMNEMFGREYRRDDLFLAVYEVLMLLFEDRAWDPIDPSEVLFLDDGSRLTYSEFRSLPKTKQAELKARGVTMVRPTWQSAIEQLTPGLVRIWHVHAKTDPVMRTHAKEEGCSLPELKRRAVRSALPLVAGDSRRTQAIREGSQGKLQRGVTPWGDLKIVPLMRWFKSRTLDAAEAWIRQEDWPRDERTEQTDIYQKSKRLDIGDGDEPGGIDLDAIPIQPGDYERIDVLSFWAKVHRACSPDAKRVLLRRLDGRSIRQISEDLDLTHWKVQSLWEEIKAIAEQIRQDQNPSTRSK